MQNQVVSSEEWLKARLELLAAEKELTRQRDALTRRRMAMPWEAVEKSYQFEGPNGALSLADLFDGRSQLIVYHFMLAPDWEEGCKSCSFWADNFNGIPIHLNHRDVTFTAVSRAPLAKINAYKKRMDWSFPWVSSYGSDFNFDYNAEIRSRRPRIVYARDQRLLQKRERRGVPHLFLLRAGHRNGQWCLSFSRPGAERSRRGGTQILDGVDRPARSVLKRSDRLLPLI